MANFVLAIDCGTQSIRGIVFDNKGNMLVKEKKEFQPYFSKKPGWAEQDPLLFWNTLCFITETLNENHKTIMQKVDTLVVTTQRDTCVLVDRDGKVLRPAISWADQRSINNPKPISMKNKIPLKLVGMDTVAHDMNIHCHAHWVQDYEPDIWEKTYKYLQLSGYLNYKLTGNFNDSVASQVGHIPFNYKKFQWERPGRLKSEIFHIEHNKLCDLVQPTKELGRVTKKASEETGLKEGMIVCAAGSDKGCETIGVGCLNNKTISISLGSMASIQTTSSKYYETETFIPPHPAVIPNHYNPEIQIYRGYWMITWFKKEFAEKEMKQAKEMGILPEKLLSSKLHEIPPGCEGLMLQPYWGGAGVKQPDARGAIIGFSDYHTRIHIYRAIIEGIGFALYDGMKKLEKKSGYKIEKVMISGGGSQSDEICKISADIFRRPVCRVQTYETSALGASMIGYIHKGVYSTFEEAVENMVHVKDIFLPDKYNSDLYEQLYEQIYKKIYKKVEPLYKSMSEIIPIHSISEITKMSRKEEDMKKCKTSS